MILTILVIGDGRGRDDGDSSHLAVRSSVLFSKRPPKRKCLQRR